MDPRLVDCDERYSEAIRAILNQAILHTTAIYDYKERTPEAMRLWFETKRKGNYPVFGLLDDAGDLMGFGSYGQFRAWPGYKYTVEHSVYVAEGFRGRGLGRRLLREVITRAEAQDYHVLVGVIDSSNTVSIRLHETLGFHRAGTIRQAGFKFGRWLDVEFYQKILTTPKDPVAA